MGLCTTRRVYLLFLAITILQIITTGGRQVFDFLGPLWSMILTNFLNIVFSIFGFFGGYTRRKHYLVSYTVWSVLWIGWNLFIVCLYIPLSQLELYKSPILSLNTGGFSWWETRAPGCVPDWTSETQLLVTNCMFDPRLMEFIQAGVQMYLAFIGIICSLSMILFPKLYDDDKDFKQSAQNSENPQSSLPAFLSLSRQNVSSHTRASNRLYNRAPIGLPAGAKGNAGGDSSDQVGGNTMDERLRPMTPRRVKRRSARSIQSQRFGQPSTSNQNLDGGDKPSTSRGSSGGSGRSSLRSNASRRGAHHRNSKRKTHQFVSPVNRLMQQQQQQVDSETSHDEPRRYLLRDQGHTNPVYQGTQSPKYGHAPPRPPSARSSYSNYHPARLPVNANSEFPNVINLNQNIFTNGGFDMSTEYNMSQHSNNTSTALYEDEVNYHPNPNLSPPMPNNNINPHQPPAPMPNGINLSFKPQNTYKNSQLIPKSIPRTDNNNGGLGAQNSMFAYPLAHSPVSQDSFPMWGVSQPQSPISNHFPSPPYQNRRPNLQMNMNSVNPHIRQPLNSETVI